MMAGVQPHATVASVIGTSLMASCVGPTDGLDFWGNGNTHILCPKTNIDSSDVQPKGQLPNILTKLSRFLIT